MEQAERSVVTLRALKERGIQLAIDDFGTGYSSLSYLKNFPVDRLKIDRSFLAEIPDPGGNEVMAAMLTLARGLGLKVVAEGVENGEQLRFLASHGCDEIQGFYLGRPMPAEKISDHLSKDQEGDGAAPYPGIIGYGES